MTPLWFRLGAVFMVLAVMTGAFGAHALRARLEPRMLEVFETGARYQMYHAIAMLAAAWIVTRFPSRYSSKKWRVAKRPISISVPQPVALPVMSASQSEA